MGKPQLKRAPRQPVHRKKHGNLVRVKEATPSLYELAKGLNGLPALEARLAVKWGNDPRFSQARQSPIRWKLERYPFDRELAEVVAWDWARTIIEATLTVPFGDPLPRWVIGFFNNMARDAPASFCIGLDADTEGRAAWQAVERLDEYGVKTHKFYQVTQMLWTVLPSAERTRLKRCPQCSIWFVDSTKNRISKRCSPKCTTATWTRARRREAGHRQYKRPRG